MLSVGGEAVDDGVAVPVGDVDVAVAGGGHVGGGVEGGLEGGPFAVAHAEEDFAIVGELEDLVGVAVYKEHVVIAVNEDAVAVH